MVRTPPYIGTQEWRRFQDFVASIERILSDNGTVQSPAYIQNLRTGRNREVDVLIQLTVGGRETSIVFECRRPRLCTEPSCGIDAIRRALHK